jgi:exopolyphosphatase/guanosine-5'-triphosphate,3'-diphosphate pyrophosphatase
LSNFQLDGPLPRKRHQWVEFVLEAVALGGEQWCSGLRKASGMVDISAHELSGTPRAAVPSFAALDLGTNNCRLLVGTPAGEGFRVVDSFSRIVRLGEGLQRSGRLSQDAMGRAMAALHGCAARLARRPVRAVRAIATEACRRAINGAEFLARVRAETGLPIDVITSREEAELALESCAPLLRRGGRRALLFDIGGGSTELAWVRLIQHRRPEVIGYVSLPVGVVTLAERFGSDGDDAAGFEAMCDDVVDRLRPFESVHCIGHEIRQGGVRFLGTSGTVTTLAGIALDLPRYSRPLVDGTVLSRADAEAAVHRLRALGRAGLAQHPCVGPERADFVLPGCAIFAAIHSLWPAPEIVVADRGLREGMLLRMIRGECPRGHRSPRPGRPATTLARA